MPSLQEALAEALEGTDFADHMERTKKAQEKRDKERLRITQAEARSIRLRALAIKKCKEEFAGMEFEEIMDIVTREFYNR